MNIAFIINLFLIILIISKISLISPETTCTEQWTQLNLEKTSWSTVGDVSILDDKSSSNSYSIQFAPSDTSSDEIINLGGAVWNSYNLVGKRGIRITFKPSIIVDTAYFGNVKYPQGFAIVLTSSSTSNLIGNKGSGLGYDGINNGIAFEFDFIRQSDKEDYKKPHLSIHYNITGEISSKSDSNCKDICNIILPNFYDNTIDDYKKNMIFEIEIIGKKLSVKTNTKTLIEVSVFEAFSLLLEQEEVFLGITASMNQNKKVTINDFSLSEISMMEKGELVLSNTIFTAGDTISMTFAIKSTCGKLLKIYPNEYTPSNENNTTNFLLIINNVEEEPSQIVFNFNDTTTQLKLDITRVKSGTYTALVKFNDNYSSPVQFKVVPGQVQRFEVCNEKETLSDGIYINSNLEQDKEKFIVPICSYDQYNNSREINKVGAQNLLKILYPNFYTGNTDLFFDIYDQKIDYKIPISTFGQYELFNESFKQNPRRFYNLSVNRISPENSDATILYGKHLIDPDKTKSVTLRLKLRDEFGRDIPNRVIKEMNCDFNGSYVDNPTFDSSDIKVEYIENDIIYLIYSFETINVGKYTFVPKIFCEGDEYNLTLKCSETEDDENSIYDKCTFYVNSGNNNVNLKKIRLYSDYSNDYIYSINEASNPDLLISLDEYNNKKLTEINLLDSSDYPLVDPKGYTITSYITYSDNTQIDLNPVKIGYSIALIFKNDELRTIFDITKKIKLTIIISKDTQSSIFENYIKFVSVDNILNNMYGESTTYSIFALYQQESYTIEASENILLYEVYGLNSETNYLMKQKLQSSNLKMKIRSEQDIFEEFILVEKDYSVLIYTDKLKKEGNYYITLSNNGIEILKDITIKVVPCGEVKKILDENNINSDNDKIYMNGDYKSLLLYDQYDNRIKDNKAILAFSQIEIISNGLKAKININGKINIYNENNYGGGASVKLVLPSGKIYEVIKTETAFAQTINPHKIYGLLDTNTSIVANTSISVNVFLLDNYGNNITSKDLPDDEIQKFSIYAIEKFGNKKKFISLNHKVGDYNIMNFNSRIISVGEYEIKIFYNNIHVSCKACHFVVSSNKLIDYQNTRLYIIGNKRKIPVFSENEESRQFLLNKKNFIINLQFYDSLFNEIAVSTQYSLTLYSEKKNDKSVKLCNYGNSKLEGKQFYHVCSDQMEKFSELENGEYKIEVNGKIFSFYVSNQETDSTDSTPTRAIYHQYENEIYGTTDSVVSLIVDLRNKNNMRINLNENILNNINIKIGGKVLDSNSYNEKKVLGPDDGLFTLILNFKEIGQYNLEINYNGEQISTRNITINISCGTINYLQNIEEPKYFNDIGTYLYFNISDINGQICDQTSNNSWNIFNNEEYIQNLIYAKNSDKDIYYPTTKYYNHLTGVFSVLIDSKINNDIILKSELFKLDLKINQSQLSKEKLNREYLYVYLNETEKQVKLKMLKKNYEPYSDIEFELSDNDVLTLSILKYLNDETTVLREYEFDNNLKGFNYYDDIKGPGDYFFVVYLNGETVPCGNCHIKVENNVEKISLKNSRVFLKSGYNRYLEGKENLTNYIYKTSFPFFKVNFMTKDNELVKVTSTDLSNFKLSLYAGTIDLILSKKANEYNGNVYFYLEQNQIKKYLQISEKGILHLSIKLNNVEKKLEYLLFDNYSPNESNYEKCNLGAQPIIVDLQPSYILRADETKEIEIYLDGCSELINQFDPSNLKLEINGETASEAIPADTYGNYILFMKYSKTIINPITVNIKYHKGKSESFQLSVLPEYTIKSIELFKDEVLGEPNTNYKYAYILMQLKDRNGNNITNFGRNLFFNDINILDIKDSNDYNLPYKLSYDDEKEMFRVEIPINGNGNIKIENKIVNEITNLYINESQIYHNFNFNMKENNYKNYSFTINFLDDFYKQIGLIHHFSKDNLSFIYITENYPTQEFYSIKISSKDLTYNEDKKEIILVLDEDVPIYNSYSFIPIISGFPQICYNCIQKNTNNSYLHSIHNNLYYPHNINKDIYLQKNYEYPIFIYFSNIDMQISSTPDIVTEMTIKDNNKYYIFGLEKNEKEDITINIKNVNKNLNIKFKKFNQNDEFETYTEEMNILMEKYFYNYISFISGNNGKLLDLYFYVDIRNSVNLKPVYISNEYTSNLLSGNVENKTLIEYLNIFQTEINGTFLVIIPRNKLINGKYTINFSRKNPVSPNNNLNSIVYHSLGAFPNIILLNNKKMLYKNMIKYDLIGENDNSELICDERLNIYIEPKSNVKFIKGDIVDNDNSNELTINSCKLYIKFIGDIKIITNLGNGFLSELTNSDNSIYNINPHYSKININKNIIKSDNETLELNISFNERSSDDLSFSEDEMPVNKGIKSIRYVTSTSYELKQNINGLYASQYILTSSQFKLNNLGTYLFIGSISNNNIEEPIFISNIRNQDEIIDNFKVNLYQDNLWTSISDIISTNNKTTEKISVKYPFKISLKLVDKYGSSVKAERGKLSVSIVSDDDNEVSYNLDLEVKLKDDYEFIIESNSSIIDNFIHMETKNSNNKFLFCFKYESIYYYVLLDSKNENNLHPRVSRKGYDSPKELLNGEYYFANEYENEQLFYVIESEPNSEIYCLVNSKGLLYNGNINPNKIGCEENYQKCEDIEIINSYRGCIKIGTKKGNRVLLITYDYKNFFLNTITLSSLPSSLDFNLLNNKEEEIAQGNLSYSYKFDILNSGSKLNIENSKFFSVYLNGQKLTKSEYTYSISNEGAISIKSELFSNTLERKKYIKVTYGRGNLDNEKEMDLVSLNVKQNSYSYSETDFKYNAQVPTNLKAGDQPYFYLIVKDYYFACYYGDDKRVSNLESISGELKETKAIHFKINSSMKLDDVPGCEYIYKFVADSEITIAGLYDIEITDNLHKITSQTFQVQMYVSPGEIMKGNIKLSEQKNIYAGETFYLTFTTKDEYENEPNYYDIVEHFEIKLFYYGTNDIIQEDSIKYQKIQVSLNKKIEITMTVIESGRYEIKVYYNGKKLTLTGDNTLTINHRECSFNEPKLSITEIDHRNDVFYSGEDVEINIYCSDIYGNLITKSGSENFKATINNNGNLITYENKFDQIHKIIFTTENDGDYEIQILLNGKKYSDSIKIRVEKFNENLFMCMNKRQVVDLKECDSTTNYNYTDLIIEIEGNENTCGDENDKGEGKAFICKINGNPVCTNNTGYCDCDEGFTNINGYCYPNENGPYDLVEKNKNKVNCLNILKAQGIDAFQCKDGSCRLNEEDCNTIFECPLGFKSCGNACILLNEKCELNNECKEDEVLCWDYSCANYYSMCPTRKSCPNGKVLCPDGTCQNSGHCPQPISRKCKNYNLHQCPDFNCVTDKDDCHKNKVCPIGQSLCEDDICSEQCKAKTDKKYKCSNGKYVENSQLCPTEMQCPSTWIKCPKGGCAQTQESCKFIQGYENLVCPKNKPILCPDYECVSTFSQCKKNYPICPPHKPYQCWNNECRKSFDECPTEIQCPENSPLLCTNGLCVSSINNCIEKNEENYVLCKKDRKIDENKIRCFDGTCVYSLELCPTYSYCGKGKVKCWNGACVDSISNCLSSDSLPPCTDPLPYRCPDGTCRKNINSCSTISVCPNSLPVKCFDNSCRATIEECPEYHSCGINKVNCPDGTCAKSFDECNTIVTCDSTKPFLCYDGSCRAQLEECPVPPSCGNKLVQCPNGSCVTSRQYCKFFSACEAKTPIRCEMNICTDALSNCPNNRQCPVGYVKCSNGDCKIMSSLCEENVCPSNIPYRCPEGVCVLDESYCDDPKSGCPYNARHKCPDGTCVNDENLCKKYDDTILAQFCEDGSYKSKQENNECPLKNGCPKDKDLKCADGTCINSSLSNCPPVYCPRNKPIKCLNGLCVVRSSDCQSTTNNEDIMEDGSIMCLDGRKVPSYDYCRPIFECVEPYKKCLDNTCRLSKEYCPENIQCPKERPYRTSDNENEFCSKYNGANSYLYCPYNTSKCESTGECIPTGTNKKCPDNPLNQTGCPENKTRCDDGRCMNSELDCILSSRACPDNNQPFLCNNGKCVSDLKYCNEEEQCSEGFIRCYNGRCVEDNEESYKKNCTNEIGCPLYKPYRCSNGECVSSQRKCEITSENENKIVLNTICDSSKPYLCSDYSCESDYTFCKLTIPCPEGYSRCFNGYCVENEKECELYKDYCPQSNPIRCPSGSCTTNILKCPESFKQVSCNEGQFYCVRLGKCVSKKSECLINYKKNNNNKFLFAKMSENVCYDGTIAENNEKCPIVPTCKVGQYRCENGGCAYSKNKCIVDDEYTCEEGEQKCPDGLCHKNCDEVAYQGCLVGEYLCSNGMCVKSEVSCAGYSMCEDPSVPYRCINGECKSDISLCPEVEKLSSIKNISYSFNKDNKIEFDFAFDPKGRSIGKLIIPSKGINFNKQYSKINVEEFSTSLVLNDSLYNNTPEFLYNISNGIEGSEGVLNFENAIMSPIFKFFSEELSEIKFNIPALLVLEHNTYTSSGFYYYDYCLAKLTCYDMINNIINYKGNSVWECVQRQERDYQKEFKLDNFGVYAIILNPLRNKTDYSTESKNIIKDNFKFILILAFALLFIGLIVFYIFSRVMRYRGKYHDNLHKIELLKQQKEEFKQMQTDVFGQSLGDNLIGIVYSKNPGYNEEDEELKEVGGLENEIEEIQRKCRNMEMQNEKLKENLDKLENEYQKVNAEIDQIKNNN